MSRYDACYDRSAKRNLNSEKKTLVSMSAKDINQ